MDFQAFGMEERVPEQMEIVLFRVAQELLNNVMRHAQANHCLVQIIRDGQRLHLTVEDNGKGFDPALAQQATGVGWLNIRSRVSYLGGTIDVQSKPGAGSSVTLECMIP
jgi:signal transduction histidine kinase